MCGDGHLEETVFSHRFRGVLVSGLLGHRCDKCGEIILSSSEGDRARKIVELKLAERARKKAA